MFLRDNAEFHKYILIQFIFPLEENKRDCWFQHGGEKARTANTETAYLNNYLVSALLCAVFGHRDLQTLSTRLLSVEISHGKRFIKITHAD
jgi:hypothetical protein